MSAVQHIARTGQFLARVSDLTSLSPRMCRITLAAPAVADQRWPLACDIAVVLSDTEFALVLMPLESVLVGQQRVRRIDDALRAAGIVAAIGWAMRQDGQGLFHASARADAALASASRQRGVDLR